MAKSCCRCEEEKPLSEFGKDSRRKDKHSYFCRECGRKASLEYSKKNRKKRCEAAMRYAKKYPEKVKANHRRYKKNNPFKFILKQSRGDAKLGGFMPCNATHEELRDSYTGVCKICGISDKVNSRRLSMDHDHETGKFRGWLCMGCNGGIGFLKDSPGLLRLAAEYIESNRAEEPNG